MIRTKLNLHPTLSFLFFLISIMLLYIRNKHFYLDKRCKTNYFEILFQIKMSVFFKFYD